MKNHLYCMFDTIKKGQLSRKNFVCNERKKICESFLKILWDEGFILGYVLCPDKIKVFLKYKNSSPAISSIKLISKPSRRVYYSIKQIWKIDSTKSFIIFSTSKGLQSIHNCKKLKIGGEPYILIK